MSFPLAGNERIKESVLAAISENRLPHAIIIEGDRGLGKQTLAGFISNAAVCPEAKAPCGECKNCHLAKIKSHPDITVIAPEDGKKNITVAQIRALKAEAYIKPHMAAYRVFIIKNAETMNEQAQNALLKVLEEPPGNVIFILLAYSAKDLLDTVISRCTCLSLVPPDIDCSMEYIAQSTEFDKQSIRDAVTLSGGNIGIALEALNGSGSSCTKAAGEYLSAVLQKNQVEMLKITAPLEKSRTEADLFLRELKTAIAGEIKKSYSKPAVCKALNRFYAKLDSFEDSLNTNINLGLLFCALALSAEELDI